MTTATRFAETMAGTLRLTVHFRQWVARDADIKPQYLYRVTDMATGETYAARDLYGPAVPRVADAEGMVGALADFLAAAAEAYAYRMQPYGPDDDAPWFPPALQEAAYLNADELAMVALEREDA